MTGRVIDRQGLRLPARATQRGHEKRAHTFTQRMLGQQSRQLQRGLRVTAQLDLTRQLLLSTRKTQLAQNTPLHTRDGARHAGQRNPLPHTQALRQQIRR